MTALIALIPVLIQYGPPALDALDHLFTLITSMVAENRVTTTAQEDAALKSALAGLDAENAIFNAAFAPKA